MGRVQRYKGARGVAVKTPALVAKHQSDSHHALDTMAQFFRGLINPRLIVGILYLLSSSALSEHPNLTGSMTLSG